MRHFVNSSQWVRFWHPCFGSFILYTVFSSFFRCLRSGQSFPRSPAGSWASPAICFAAPVTFSDSSTFSSWTPTVEGAVRKKHSLKPRSCMQELSSKSADESWGGSRKSKLSSGVISPNYSEDYKSSMFVARTLCSSFWTTTGTLLKNWVSSSGTQTAWKNSWVKSCSASKSCLNFVLSFCYLVRWNSA